jgi:hypothetical protein
MDTPPTPVPVGRVVRVPPEYYCLSGNVEATHPMPDSEPCEDCVTVIDYELILALWRKQPESMDDQGVPDRLGISPRVYNNVVEHLRSRQ